jgi:6-phospho-beta-glucosidase
MADPPVLTIIGGGVWVAALVEQLVVTIKEQALEIRLVARDFDRLGVIADYCRRISISRANWRILTQTLDAALDGVDICVLLLRVGGLAARELDENFPRRFGLVGDEGLGPGGYANALRTLPTMSTIARKLAVASPDVIAINLVAPLGMTTRVLLEQGLNAVGLCELPITTERALRKTFPPDISVQALNFTGLNHLGWFWSPGVDLPLFEQAAAARLVDEDVLRNFDAAPLYYYYKVFNRAAARALGVADGAGRAEELSQISAAALREFSSGVLRPPSLYKRMMPWFNDALVPVLGALLDGGSWHGFANLRSTVDTDWCAADTVIEGRATLERASMRLEEVPRPTNANLIRFLSSAVRADACIYRGALSGDIARNVRIALEEGPLDPPRAHLSEITRAICEAGGQFLS